MMKLIAHRGASLLCQENSLESLKLAAELGADAVECDIRKTNDGEYIIFHDENLQRMANESVNINDLTLRDLRERLQNYHCSVLTFDRLRTEYQKSVPILLHIKLNATDDAFASMLYESGLPLICGVQHPEAAQQLHRYFPSEQILAFAPTSDRFGAFQRAGAGILRVWEDWLPSLSMDTIKREFDTMVWVMAHDQNGSMNGNMDFLDRMCQLHADGVLLNDISLGIRWKNTQC